MPNLNQLLEHGPARTASGLAALYKPGQLPEQQARYRALLKTFAARFPGQTTVEIFSAPGRTEVGGNHTDHNGGRVLAAAVDLDILAVAAPTAAGGLTLCSEGYPLIQIDLDGLAPVAAERGTSAALVRGVGARLKALGYRVGSFAACVTSNVLKGSGLSSSAAYEVLIATIINHLYNAGQIDPLVCAQAGQFAENEYFGKPCGLMDQAASALGGFVMIDFEDLARPAARKVDFDFTASGYSLVIVDTGGSHVDLTEDYAAVPREMQQVAHRLGGQRLCDVPAERMLEQLAALRPQVGDRALLRALHFYADDRRVVEQVAALERNDFQRFLELVIESGYSSWTLAQNCYSSHNVAEQGLSLALALSEKALKGHGAWRVHGGGFAGTIQAFVPNGQLASYVAQMHRVFGPSACYELMIRLSGATKVEVG